tara:strand:+ start:90508 stop:91836 length:1329 start_codon:yes stop_codon:yes gene_type:complete
MRKQIVSFSYATALAAIAIPSYALEDLNKFNPAISVIFDGLYYHDNVKGTGPELLEQHNSVLHSDVHDHDEHAHDALTSGFNLRETEIVMSGTVDPYFDAFLTAALSGDGIELEEAWFQSRNLPAGLQLKGGKFLSGFGYHNEKHTHSWDFADQNLAYLSLLGDHGLSGNGLQLTWLAPTPFFIQLGAELLQGEELEKFGAMLDNEELAEEISAEFDPNGNGEFSVEELNFDSKSGPHLSVAFARFGPDLGTDHALQFGASVAHHNDTQSFHEESSGEAFAAQGHANLYGIQAVFKRFPRSDYGKGGYSLQGEYLRFDADERATFHTDSTEIGLPISFKQDAAYVQGSYGFAPRWQLALRTAAAGIGGTLRKGNEQTETGISRQHSIALSWYATEFSRLRLQFSRNDINFGTHDIDTSQDGNFNQVFLQYNLSLGAHGAHTF